MRISNTFPSMMAALSVYFSRSQARKYSKPTQKNKIVHTTKAASLMEHSPTIIQLTPAL